MERAYLEDYDTNMDGEKVLARGINREHEGVKTGQYVVLCDNIVKLVEVTKSRGGKVGIPKMLMVGLCLKDGKKKEVVRAMRLGVLYPA